MERCMQHALLAALQALVVILPTALLLPVVFALY